MSSGRLIEALQAAITGKLETGTSVRVTGTIITTPGGTQDVNITQVGGVPVTTAVPVSATDLDIRNLVFATDKVDASGSSVALDATTLAALESITVQNGAGAAAVNIQDGGNSITVDGSVTVSGSVTADTELPAAVALADNTANPTVPGVGAFLMGFDGTNWDRVRADGGSVFIQDGGNSITVDGTVTANAGSGTFTVSGTVAATQSGTWNIGTVTTVTTVATLTTITNPVTTAPGAFTLSATTVATDTEVSVTTSTTALLAANASRKRVWIQNHGTGFVRVRLAATALVTSPIRLVPACGIYELLPSDGYIYRGVINAISESGTNLVGVIEET